MSTNNSYTVRSRPVIQRRPSKLEQAIRRTQQIPGLSDDNELAQQRLVLTGELRSTLADMGMHVSLTDAVTTSGLWAESPDGLVLAAKAYDDGTVDIEVVNVAGPRCTEVVAQVVQQLRTKGFEMELDCENLHNTPSGVHLGSVGSRHLATGGRNPSAALVEESERPSWTESSSSESSRQKRQGIG